MVDEADKKILLKELGLLSYIGTFMMRIGFGGYG